MESIYQRYLRFETLIEQPPTFWDKRSRKLERIPSYPLGYQNY